MKFCCEDMEEHIYIVNYLLTDNDELSGFNKINYFPNMREYGILSNEDSSYYLIYYCPWCGCKLPNSLRQEWFDELEQLGFDSPLSEEIEKIPIEFLTDKWWNKDESN